MKFTFSRAERLKSKVILASLFEKGSLFVSKPVLVKYLVEPAKETSIQATFSVPKRRFKRAVDRNLLKRRIREVHRLHKHHIYTSISQQPCRVSILYIYKRNEILSYQEIEQSLSKFYQQEFSL